MRIINRLALFLVVAAAVADAPVLLGQRQGGPNTAGRQGGPETTGRGRQDGPPEGRGGRGRGGQLPTGTSAIRGRVVNAMTGTPVRRASIQATFVNEQGQGQPGRSATTDDNGAFLLRDLPAGRWTLRAAKTGYIEQQFGQRSAFATTDPITLAEGQQFAADFRLSRGGAITGRLVDEFGDPIAGANVSVLRIQNTAQGQRTTRAGTSVPSDDTGAYRVYGLPAGQYYVSVNDPSAARMVVTINDVAGGVTSGVISASRIEIEDVAVANQLRDTVRASFASTSYAPTYYPGTVNIADAQRITLALGEEQSGINLAIVPVRAARITGRVTNSIGAPLQATISLLNQTGQSYNPTGGRNGSGADGSFTLTNVPPGNYRLNVLGPSSAAAPPEVASMPVAVDGSDLVGLTITTGSGASVQGSVVAEGGSKLPAAKIRVTAVSVDNAPATSAPPRAEVNANDTFQLDGLLGVYTMRFESLPSGWIIKSVTANGVDVSDSAMEFRPADRISMRVELTDRITQVIGTVRSDRPISGATVVIFADEPSKWTGSSRFVKTARLTDQGQFTVSGLPPHQRYLAVAVDYIEPGEPQTAEFLQRAKAVASVGFGLSTGDQRTIEVPLLIR
jgi:hypothetical protein